MTEDKAEHPSQTLEYATPEGRPARTGRFSWPVALLLLAIFFVGSGECLSLLYADRIGTATAVMVPTGGILLYVVFAWLAVDQPKLHRAVIGIAIALLLAATSLVLNQVTLNNTAAEIRRTSTPVNGVIIVYFEREIGARYMTQEIARNISAAATLCSVLLLGWLLERIRRVRAIIRSQRASSTP